MDEKWREQTRAKMDGLKRTAPDVSWSEIDKALAQRRARMAGTDTAKGKTVALFGQKGRWAAAAAVALLAAGGASLWLKQGDQPQTAMMTNAVERQQDIMGQEKAAIKQETADITQSDQQTAWASDRADDKTADNSNATDRRQPTVNRQDTTVATVETLRIEQGDTPVCTAEENAQPVGSVQSAKTTDRHNDHKRPERNGKIILKQTPSLHRTKSSAIGIQPSLYVGNALMGAGQQTMDRGVSMASDAQQRNDLYGEEIVMGSNKHTLYYDYGTEDSKHHDLPIRVGLSVRLNLGDQWSLESGVNYTYLRSTFTRESNTYQEKRTQKLNYIGIPLTVSRSLWRNNSLNIYLSAGTMAELLVKGKSDITYTAYGDLQNTDQDAVSSHRLQWSVNGAMGVEWRAAKNIGIYAEPGVGYYLDNHDGIDNRYKDKPWNMNLNMGLRLNFR